MTNIGWDNGMAPIWRQAVFKARNHLNNRHINALFSWRGVTGVKQLLNQFWVIAHYKPRSKSPWKWKINQDISSSSLSAAYICQRIGWALFQIMACRLFSAKPLPKPMRTYCQLDPLEQTSIKLEPKYEVFSSWKCIWKDRLRNGGHFVQGEMS